MWYFDRRGAYKYLREFFIVSSIKYQPTSSRRKEEEVLTTYVPTYLGR
jgi:hypothetical protein